MKQIIRNIFSAKILKIAFIVGLIIIAGSTWALLNRQSEATAISKIALANTQHKKGKNNLSQVSGQVTNQDDKAHSVELKALFYGTDGGVVGRAIGQVPELPAGETQIFYLYTSADISGFIDYKVEATNIY